MTKDISRRLKEHNSGKTRSTKGYRPWRLFFYEEYETLDESLFREKYLKSGIGKEYIKARWSRSSTGYLPAGRQGASKKRKGKKD